jgi:alkaline phosphatase
MTPDGQTSVLSIATAAQERGMAVGVATSVSIDHATPASFYAHEASRSNYHRIGHDLLEAKFDFYAGSAFLQPTHKDCPNELPLYQLYENAGYTLLKGNVIDNKKVKKAKRLMLLQSDEANAFDNTALPYAIDRGENDLTLATIVSTGIDFLMKKNKDGFFFAIEGGKIDWACHANDAAAVIQETIDLDEAVKVALEFYKQHPDETLIVVTADHETGGMSLGTGAYELRLHLLQHQKMSAWKYTKHISQLHTTLGDAFTWDVVKKDLTENFGFWEHIAISERQEARLKKAYEALVAGKAEGNKSLYSQEDALSSAAKEIINRAVLVGWTSGGHSNGYVPAFAIGVGAEQFSGRIDNTEVPKRTLKIMSKE